MSLYKRDDLLSVLLALEQRIMKRLQVATLAVVTEINTTKMTCMVKPFPIFDEKAIEITCKYAESLNDDLTIGSIVVVLFLNKDSVNNLELFEKDINNDIMLNVKTTHSEKNGVVIQIFRKKVI